MENAVGNMKDDQLWLDAIEAKFEGGKPFGKKDWDRLLGHCQAVTDFPAVLFGPELIAAYPEAKVVLTERDIDRWHEYKSRDRCDLNKVVGLTLLLRSVTNTIDRYYRDWALWFLTYVDHMNAFYGRMFYKMWFYFSNGDFATYGKERYKQHYEEVRKLVPPENLLTYKVGEGWEPLCKFLELSIPDTPFPTGNDQESFWKSTRAWQRARGMAAVKKALPWAVSVIVLPVALRFHRYL
ncbi:hypothetical protein ACLMJK_003929 [Lecanora helva]